tara:strand:- start:1451 stop:3397 length:1947 start_codon:yes stop_codon:yes gene_type:complete
MINAAQNLSKYLSALPRYAKRLLLIIIDSALCVVSTWIAFYVRLGEFVYLEDSKLSVTILALFLSTTVFWISGLYRSMIRYNNQLAATGPVTFAIFVYGLIFFSIITVYGIQNVPRTIGIIQPLILFLVISISRLIAQYMLNISSVGQIQKTLVPNALIYGVGSAGSQLLSILDNGTELQVVGFLEDDIKLHGQKLNGKTIYSPNNLKKLIETKNISQVFLALPSISRNKRKQIIDNLNKYKVIVKTLPSVSDLVDGRVTISDIRDLEIEDLLGREQVEPYKELLSKNIVSKVVLITGAGGSIGSELSRQIFKLDPKKIILLDVSEFALYKIQSELENIQSKLKDKKYVEIISLLASVKDEKKISSIINTWRPDTLYHAAAYKHVPLVEENISEGIENNVFGTLNVVNFAIKFDISNVVIVSTDKAVRPTNIMGASKRLSELCAQALIDKNISSSTKISIVRFGNVLDSSGSVIPKFKNQIREGGPITLTHPEVTRFFMTIPEAAQLIIQAGALTESNEIFVLDMGKSIKIRDLIYKMVKLSGLSVLDEKNPDGDIKIINIGLRPGEKLYEELLLGKELKETKHVKIKKANDPYIPWEKLESKLDNLKLLIKDNNVIEILSFLKKNVNDYSPTEKIVDKIFNQRKNKN